MASVPASLGTRPSTRGTEQVASASLNPPEPAVASTAPVASAGAKSPRPVPSGRPAGVDSQLPPLPVGKEAGASADLRNVQASLDRIQGSKKEDSEGGHGASYNAERVLGSGAFGIVYQARIVETNEMVAIKKVLQDARFKNRELEIMQELRHPNVVEFKNAFHVPGEKPKENYLNVVMEYCPETMQGLLSQFTKRGEQVPVVLVQLYTYHMLRGVAYLHARSVCHRDIKPPNVLINEDTYELKICDFGSAKRLSKGEPNVAYICSRYYRAPELIFGATDYSTLIDMWSVACVTAEMILQQVLFPGDSGVDQLMEIIKVLGTPSADDLNSMNPVYGEFKFPQIKSYPWSKIFRSRTTPEAVDWLSRVLQYDPKKRPTGLQACMHTFFQPLRERGLTQATPLSMFWFSDEELALMTEDMSKLLIPDWVDIVQGGPVPRDLGLCKRPPAPPKQNEDATQRSSSPAADALPPLEEKRPRTREHGRSSTDERQKTAEDGKGRSADCSSAKGGSDAVGVDMPTPSSPSSKHGEGRRHKKRSSEEGGEEGGEPSSPSHAHGEGRRHRKRSSEEGGEEGGEPREPRDRHHRKSSEDGEHSRREKRKSREKRRSDEAHLLDAGAPLAAALPPKSPAAGATGSEAQASGRQWTAADIARTLQASMNNASDGGDPLADFSYAMRSSAEPQGESRSKHGGRRDRGDRTEREQPGGAEGASGAVHRRSETGGKMPLASAGAMQLVPAAAAASMPR